ncbi:diaminopimelate decarboxylase family protein [Streptomyces virginiae]|uniref:diaminopimelate decarboxylase family protein n=1 Tax=Streptomyces virginiae TaxID=1961 RepID=UPI003659C9A6
MTAANRRSPGFPHACERTLGYLSRDARGGLQVLGRDAEELLLTFGSPLLVLLPDRVEANVRSVYDAFGSRFPAVSVHYAVKSCYYEPVVRAALRAGAGLEVMSALEMQIAEQTGCAPDGLVINGLGRDEAYVRRGVRSPGSLHVLDTWDDLTAIATAASDEQRMVDVALRVVPQMPGDLDNAMPLDSKLGNHAGSDDFWRMCDVVAEHPWLALRGLHGHQFTRAGSPADYGQFVAGLAAVACEAVARKGIQFDVIDIGGGFDTRSILESRGTPLSEFADVAAKELAAVPYPFLLVVEPGRYVAADAGIGLTRVRARKEREGFTWQVVDLATNTLIPVPGAEYLPIPVQDSECDSRISRIGDGTCAPSVICDEIELPVTVPGTPLAILHCGAYTTVFAHVWGPRPPTVISLDGASGPVVLTGPDDFKAAARSVYGYELDLGEMRHAP